MEITWSPADGEAQPLLSRAGEEMAALFGLTNVTEYTFTLVTVDTTDTRSDGTTVTATPGPTTSGYMTPAAQDEVTCRLRLRGPYPVPIW